MLQPLLCLFGIHSRDRALIWSKRGRKRTRARYLCNACRREFETSGKS